MTSDERRISILNLLRKNKYMSLRNLAKNIAYSESTVRRDLNILERQNLVKRIRGGAIPIDESLIENRQSVKQNINTLLKKEIADLAIDFVEDYQTIFLDSSSTSQSLAHLLTRKNNLNIFTPNLVTARLLESGKSNNVFLLGGKMRDSICEGKFVLDTISQLNFDIAFISTRGFSVNHGFSERIESESSIKQLVKQKSDKVVMLIDEVNCKMKCIEKRTTKNQ
ncbi:DeoR/GlpR family DNA-binding transcription regulator [Aerococcus sp. JJEM-2022a]|uniref:DeoR/GlpR family DNA-binding transcription regulator n=1 Tax=Aerococcus loyolae TaxID=2976809 RepID=A0ABT4BZP5_9LACT|nr:DeoR/GlpR family DNA-binding transcription regulator [Aerococcus loyolae]MCY3024903.1 DeoR/GlpR family DNA-binding transcription regulator [Aerococcus loyolae]